MKKLLTGSLIGIIFLFNGCTTSFLKLNHSKENKITTLSFGEKTYVLVNSQELRKDNTSGNFLTHKARMGTQSFISEDEDCKQLQYRETENLANSNRYYNTSSKEDIYRQNRNNCTTERINRVDFHDCDYKNAITHDISGQHGISQKKYILIDNKQCFYKLRNFVKGEKTSYDQKKYIGTFTAESNQYKCGTGGDLKVVISPSNKINGTASYMYKGKKASTSLWGEVKNNKFHGETRNVKFYGDIIDKDMNKIEGEYFNRSCKGTFTLLKQ